MAGVTEKLPVDMVNQKQFSPHRGPFTSDRLHHNPAFADAYSFSATTSTARL
jgi:hypothetical protein